MGAKSKISTTIYFGLEEDAENLSKLFGFKITPLNDSVKKAGFPAKKLEFYTRLLSNCSVDFEIVDTIQGKVKNVSDYLKEESLKNTFNSIKQLDMNKVTFQEAFFILKDLNEKLNKLQKEDEV